MTSRCATVCAVRSNRYKRELIRTSVASFHAKRDHMEQTIKVNDVIREMRRELAFRHKRSSNGKTFNEKGASGSTPKEKTSPLSSGPRNVAVTEGKCTQGKCNMRESSELKSGSGDMSRMQAERLLAKHSLNGAYVIRGSGVDGIAAKVSLFLANKTYHFHIRRQSNEKFALGATQRKNEFVFKTLEDLLDYYSTHDLVLLDSNGNQQKARLLTRIFAPPCQ